MAASWVSAARAPCASSPPPYSPVGCSASPVRDGVCARSKEWPAGAGCTRSRTPSPRSARRSAATARRRSCSPPRPCSRGTPAPAGKTSSTRCRATSAAARATSRSTRPWSWPRPACAASVPSLHRRACMASGKPAFRVVGKALRKVDATAKVTGTTRFADDLFLPRMLYAKLLRSPHALARIVSIDASPAAALAGVKAVLTGKDLPIPFGILPVSQDEHALALDKVRFVGDPVAAVPATSGDATAAPPARIALSDAPLRPVTGAADALAHPEPRIHDYGDLGHPHKLIHP